jgi:2-polyprenyl-3-methyl-5-hydroxy-6-metoxy-1,4-benzoquinol methylase
LEGLTEALRTGQAQTHRLRFLSDADRAAQVHTPRDCYSLLLAYPDEYRLFLQMMDATSAGVGALISEQAGLAGVSTLVDVGGGGGQIHRELLQQNPQLSVLMLDLAPACLYAAEQAARTGLSSRVRFVHASMFDEDTPPPLQGADAVLLAGVLADWDLDEQRAIVRNCKRLLRPGGALLISETLFNAERQGPFLPALLSIFMLLATRGDNLTAKEATTLLQECGFVDVAVHDNSARGMRDLIVARTPHSG